MSRRKQDQAVAERAQQIIAEKSQRRRGRKGAKAEAPAQPAAEQPARPKRERPRKERKPRVHEDLLTVAFRGPLAGHFRELVDRHQMNLARLLQDAMLHWEGEVAGGYQPGSALAEWKGRQGPGSEAA